jgi:hypothetical protein
VPWLLLVESYDDGAKLLELAERFKLGSSRSGRPRPYRSGECRNWLKVKTASWRVANGERWRLFERTS